MKNIINWQQRVLSIVLILAYFQGAWADNQPVNYANLLHNYNFTGADGTVPDGWNLIGPGEIEATPVNNIAGTQAMSLDSQDQNNPSVLSQAINGTPNTGYSVAFWGYRNGSTQTTGTGNHNLTISFGQRSWHVDPPVNLWKSWTFNGTGIGSDDKLQWSGFDVTGAHLVIGYPCYFLTNGGPAASNSGYTGPTSSPDNSSASSHMSYSQKVGAIVGGLFGGLILVAAIVAFLLWYRKKKNSNPVKISTNSAPTSADERKFLVEPYGANNPPWAIPASPIAPISPHSHINPSIAVAPPTMAMSNHPNQDPAVERANSTHVAAANARPTSSSTAYSTAGGFAHTSSSPSPTFGSLPPEYVGAASRTLLPTYRPTSQDGPLQNMSPLLNVDDELGRWAANHRNSISVDLEHKLRNAHYRPSDNPREISDTVWNEQYGVGYFELKRIQELYEEQGNRMTQVREE